MKTSSSIAKRRPVRVLGIETSSRRGTVALSNGSECLVRLEHDTPQAHAESLLPMIDRALAECGWTKTSLDRVGVGVGPGSFTGVRVGIALAQGIASALQISAVGLRSLATMAAAVAAEEPRVRCAVLDARRGEAFIAAYGIDGTEVLEPEAIPTAEVVPRVSATLGDCVFIGQFAMDLGLNGVLTSPETDLPDAKYTALLAARVVDPNEASAVPYYLRDADAKLPSLPPSPLKSPPPDGG